MPDTQQTTADRSDAPVPDGAACLVPGAERPTHRLVAEVDAGLGPEGAVIDVARRRAYVTSSRSHAVTILDLDLYQPLGKIPVGSEPTDTQLDEDTQRLFVCDLRSSTVTTISPESETVETVLEVPGYPSSLMIDPASRRLYCGCAAGAAVAIIDMDSVQVIATVANAPKPGSPLTSLRSGR